MKPIALFICLLCTITLCNAQAYDGTADYNKGSQAAIIAEFKYPQSTVEKSLRDKLERLGLKLKSNKGYIVAYNSIISAISGTQMDYAFMVDRKSKRDKETTVITLVTNLNNVNTISENANKAKEFLNELQPAVDALYVENLIAEQTLALEKAQKKNKNLQDDIANIEKKIRNLQDDLAKTNSQQQEQVKEVQRQQEILDTVKAKRK